MNGPPYGRNPEFVARQESNCKWPKLDLMLHRLPAGSARTNSMTTEQAPPLPLHVEETVATIAALHAAHYREARALQKAVSRATRGIAQPAMLIVGAACHRRRAGEARPRVRG